MSRDRMRRSDMITEILWIRSCGKGFCAKQIKDMTRRTSRKEKTKLQNIQDITNE